MTCDDGALEAQGTLVCGGTADGSTVGAGSVHGNGAGDHLYSIHLDTRTNVRFDSCDSDYDTWLRVIDVNAQEEYAGCDDCGECGLQTVLDAELEPGDYYLVIEGFSTSEGHYSVDMVCENQQMALDGTVDVASAADTAEEDIASHTVSLVSHRLALGSSTVAVRYQDVLVPQGVTVTEAHIEFAINQVYLQSGQDVTLSISVELAGSASAAINAINNADISSRTFASSTVTWSPEGCADAECTAAVLRTPSLQSLLQQVVSQPRWVAGSAVMFKFEYVTGRGVRWLDSIAGYFEGADHIGPRLQYTYEDTVFEDGDIHCDDIVQGSTAGAGSTIGGASSEHVYNFQITEDNVVTDSGNALVRFDACQSQFDTWLRIMNRDLTTEFIGCDDCGPCGLQTVLDAQLPPGEYALVIEGFSSSEGVYSVAMSCMDAASDSSMGPIACAQTVQGDTSGGFSTVGGGSAEHLYTFHLDAPTAVQFDSCASSFDTWLRVLDVTTQTELDGCDDCGECGTRTVLDTFLDAGDYVLVIEGWSSSEGEYSVVMNCPADSGFNDGHISCDGDDQTVTGNTVGSPSMLGSASGEHHYMFEMPVGEHLVTFDSCASQYDTYLHVFDRTHTNSLAACDDCGPCGLQTVLDARLVCATTSGEYNAATGHCEYVLVIEGYSSSEGDYSVTMTCEDGALSFRGTLVCGDAAIGSTVGAGNFLGNGAGDALWHFTIDTEMLVQFNSCGSDYDTWLRVLSADMSLELDGCDDCGECGVRSVLDADLSPGDYVLVIEGFSQSEGNYNVLMDCPSQSGVVQGFNDGSMSCGDHISGTTVLAGSHLGNGASDHIYAFTLGTENPTWYVQFDSCNSAFDTWLRIFNHDLTEELAGCDDCGPCGTRTVLDAVLPAGDYQLVVEGYAANEGLYEVDMTCSGGPDSTTLPTIACEGAESTVTGSTVGADSNYGSGAGEILYHFNIPGDPTNPLQFTPVTFNSCGSNYDTFLRIITLNENGAQELHACDDCGDCGLQTVLEASLPAGDYVLVIEGYSTSEGDFTVAMTCTPEVVDIGTMLEIDCGGNVTGTTVGGSNIIPGGASPEVLYHFNVGAGQNLVQFDSCGSGFDTWLRVVSPSLGEEFYSCDDCGPCGVQTVLDLDLPPGDYVLVVEGYSASEGVYTIDMNCASESAGFLDGSLTCGVPITGTTVSAGSHLGNGAGDHIYDFTVTQAGSYTFDSCCSQFDTWLRVFRGTEDDLASVLDLNNDVANQCDTGNPDQVGCELLSCDDCGPCGLQTVLTGSLEAGNYLLIVEGYWASEGEYVVQMRPTSEASSCGACSAVPVQDRCTVVESDQC